jgi:D-glycero-D-manno-heptose 1,7-bisphosphate phosphatase
MTPAVFLDRDGTLIEDADYLRRLDQILLFPWTIDALRLLNRAGFRTVVVTNQSAVARGFVTEEFVRETHAALDALVTVGGARIDGYYFCPHHPEAAIERYRTACRCRKPGPGMIEQATADLGLDLSRSWMVGNRWLDVETGTSAGTKSILVQPDVAAGLQTGGHGLQTREHRADAILNNLMEAVGWILRASTSR